jgi:hypothetical protein
MEHCKNALLWNKIIDDEATTEKTLGNVDDDIQLHKLATNITERN